MGIDFDNGFIWIVRDCKQRCSVPFVIFRFFHLLLLVSLLGCASCLYLYQQF